MVTDTSIKKRGGWGGNSTQKRRARHKGNAKRAAALDGWDRVSALSCKDKMLSADPNYKE